MTDSWWPISSAETGSSSKSQFEPRSRRRANLGQHVRQLCPLLFAARQLLTGARGMGAQPDPGQGVKLNRDAGCAGAVAALVVTDQRAAVALKGEE